MKDQFQPSLCKLANNVHPDSALLFGDDLADHIKSLNNSINLMKPAKMLNKQEVFGKKPPKNPALLRKLCLWDERAASPEKLILWSLLNWAKSISNAKQTLEIHIYEIHILFMICHKKLNVSQLEIFITTSLSGNL